MDMATAPDEFPAQSVPGSGGGLPDAGRSLAPPSLFQSFWMGGFEASYHINRSGLRVDMQAVTQHDVLAREDYRQLKEFGVSTARDGIRWNLIDRAGSYDFTSFAPMLQAARE